MQIYIINLKNATERRDFQTEQCQKLGLDCTFLPATSVADLKPEIFTRHYFDWQRPLRKPEVACYFSHQNAWKQVRKDDKPALILEDDALLAHNLPELLDLLDKRRDFDLINCENRTRKKTVSRQSAQLSDNYQILRLYQDRTGAAGYILSPSGAKKLLNCEKRVGIALADAHITNCHALIGFQIEPAPIIQLDVCAHYHIPRQFSEKLTNSIASTGKKAPKTWFFRKKRIIFQIKLGIRQLSLLFRAKKRLIKLNISDF